MKIIGTKKPIGCAADLLFRRALSQKLKAMMANAASSRVHQRMK